MFFEAVFIPETTVIQGASPGIEASLETLVVRGLLVTNGIDFDRAVAYPSNHQYKLNATVN
jgi:hypothetical protein